MGVVYLVAPFGGGVQLISDNFNSNSKEFDLINDNWNDGLVNALLQQKVAEEKGFRLDLDDFTAEEMNCWLLSFLRWNLIFLT